MPVSFVKQIKLPKSDFLKPIHNKRQLISFDLELTARCNNNCRHCYINLPSNDKQVKKKELTLLEIKNIVDQTVDLGALWCLLTGGEPLLREDFFDIYLYLKKKGLLISVFTNATLLTAKHIEFFKKYPPRDIEITVYGTTKETYEKVTRNKGSFNAFLSGVNLLLSNGIKTRFKAMALRSNVNELPRISAFCRKRTKDYFRFDPFLHMRFDGDKKRNAEIQSERLDSKKIITIEQNDPERKQALKKDCNNLIIPELANLNCNHIFHCDAGTKSFTISYDGYFKLCSSLCHPDCILDLKKETLLQAWQYFVPQVRNNRSTKKDFLKKCHVCPLFNLCIWCPAHSYLETGALDMPVDYFCEVAHAREKMLLEPAIIT
ncbi:MAG: radical SAM protein [Candidatus Omnitrophota bacterium]